MHLCHQASHDLLVLGLLWHKRIQHGLVLTGRQQAAFDAKFLHGLGKPKAVHTHTNRTNQAGLVDVNLIGSRRNVIATRGSDVLDDSHHRLVRIGLFQAANLVEDHAGLNGTATWRVQAQHDALGLLGLKGLCQRLTHHKPICLTLGLNHTFDVDDGRVGPLDHIGPMQARTARKDHPSDHQQDHQAQQAAHHGPATSPPLFGDLGQQ